MEEHETNDVGQKLCWAQLHAENIFPRDVTGMAGDREIRFFLLCKELPTGS